jgi:hypothetical protein
MPIFLLSSLLVFEKSGKAALLTAVLLTTAATAFGQRPPGVPPLVIAPPTITTVQTGEPSPYFTGYVGAHLPSNPKPQPQEYKLEETDFLYRYGASDTAAALIHMYFRKRNSGHWIFISSLAPLGVALTGQKREQQIGGPNNGSVTTTDKPYVAPFTYMALGLEFFGAIKALAWNRQTLYRDLLNYQQTHKLSPSMRRRLLPYLIKTRNREFGD